MLLKLNTQFFAYVYIILHNHKPNLINQTAKRFKGTTPYMAHIVLPFDPLKVIRDDK